MDRVWVADVALDPRTGGSDAIYTYRADESVRVGEARFVPIGNRPTLGTVIDVYLADEKALGFEFESLKTLGDRVSNLSLPTALVDLAEFVSAEYLCSLPTALAPANPPGIQERLTTSWSLLGPIVSDELELSGEESIKLTPAQQEAMRTLQDAGGSIQESVSRRIPPAQAKVLAQLATKGLVAREIQVQPFQDRRVSKDYFGLNPDHDLVEKFLTEQGVRKPAQALTLMQLQAAENSYFSMGEIKALGGVTETTVKALLTAGLIIPVDPERHHKKASPTPNRLQQLAIDAVADSVATAVAKTFLLFGVTGSGKTEVYMRLAQMALSHGRQVLYLVPEIALATQSIGLLRERFGQGVTILHSELPPGDRLANWLKIRDGHAPIVLGARSALFAPLENIGLIIVDEEHEASYKQDSLPRYHAKRLAEFLSKHHACPLILGSATPSIESYAEAEEEKITLLSLPQRAATAKLPEVHVVDLSLGYRQGKPAILSDELQAKMEAALSRGEQTILFLNRRAYASFLICRDCGEQMICPRCSVSLSYHRRDGLLRCHHCDYRTRAPDTCPQCGGLRISPFGIGTEKVEETVGQIFPNARLARLDRDIARKKGALEAVLAAFRSGEIDVLVGTQMVAKGLDFPNVTLVGVVAADVSLNIPDFRSSEHTFQLLSQVAGRAGRGSKLGEVVIQTFNPEHIAVRTAKTHDFPAFYEVLKDERLAAGYPPFVRLVNIILSGEQLDSVIRASSDVAGRLTQGMGSGAEILGPANCPLERLNNRWRRHLLVKLPLETPPSDIAVALDGFGHRGVMATIDVDAFSLM